MGNWQKSTVMPSSYEVQTLKMSSGYTAKVKNMPWVGSNKGLYIKLEFIQVILISELSIVASRSCNFNVEFPTVARFWILEAGKVVFHHK